MRNIYSELLSKKKFSLVFLMLFLLLGRVEKVASQSCTCGGTVPTFNVDLSAATDTTWTLSNQTRDGLCCSASGSDKCIRFIVTVNPASDLVNFFVTNPAPLGGAFYQIDCGPQISLGTPACILGMTTFCITYCKAGGDSPDYVITATSTVQASNDIIIREGCSANLSVTGLQSATVTWNGLVNPALYNTYLSCTSGCSTTTITAPPGSAPATINYVVSGTPTTNCPGIATDTVQVTIVPGLTASISPVSPVICSGTGFVVLTATPVGGSPPYTYLWNTGDTTQSITVNTPGNYTVDVGDQASGCPPIPVSVTVTASPTPADPVVGSNSPLCEGQTLNLTASSDPGATYSWTGPNSFSSSLQNPSITNVTTAEAGTYTVTANLGGCLSNPVSTVVVINNAPAAPTAGSNSPVCEGQTINLTASNIAGATYSWTGPNSFSSSLQNPTITNATSANAGVYSVTATVGGCTGPAGTVTVTVSPAPIAPTAGSNSPVCVGDPINLTASNIAGATYSWTGPNSFSSSSQNPVIGSATLSNAGVYSVTATVAGCTGPAGTTTVVVNPVPATPTASSNSPVCQGQTINLSTPAIAGATYSWTGPNSFSSSLQNPTVSNAQAVNAGVYSVTVTVSGCTSAAGTATVVVNPVPATPTASSNSPVCQGQTINLSTPAVAGATYSWSGPNSFSSTLQNPTVSNAQAVNAGTYSVTVTVGGCGSAAGTTTVVVNPTPAAPTASSNSPLCVGQTINLSTPAVAGATYSWTGPNSFSSSAQNPTIVNATTANAGTYSLTITVAGCTSAAGTVDVIVNTTPATPVAGSNSPICEGQTLNLTASLIPGATYSWSGPNGFSSTLQNPTISGATSAAAGTYTVTANNGCASSPATTTVVINPTPAAPTAGSNSPLCEGDNLNLTASNIAGATYSWTGPNSFSSSTQNPTINGVSVADAGTYSVTATVGGCTSTAGTVAVIVNPIPAAPTAGSNSPVCEGQTMVLTASNVPGATYSWSGPGGYSSSTQNPTRPNATLAMAGVYTVTATVAGCSSSGGTVNVTVNPTPAAPTASSNSPVCSGNSIDLTASNIAGATYSWTGPNSFSSSLQNPSIPGSTTANAGIYSVTATVGGCTSVVATTTVVVNQTPATPTASSNSPICINQIINLSTTAVAGATYSWSGPNSFSSSLQNPSIPNATTANAGTYSLTITVAGCTSAAGTVDVVVNSAPATPVAGSNSPVCEGQNLDLTASLIPGATYSWSGPNGFSSTLQNPTISGATSAAAGTYTVIANNGCASSPATTTVVINPTPAAPTAGSNSPVCEAGTINLTSNLVAGATYSWTGPNSFTSSVQNPSIGSVNITHSGMYYVTVTVAGCTSFPDSVNVIVSVPAIADAGPDQTVCANNSSAVMNGVVLNGSTTGIWSTSGTGTFTPGNTDLNATYNPTAADTTAGVIIITLTTTNTPGCTDDTDFMTLTITDAPTVNAGSNQSVCSNNASAALNGIITDASGGIWTSSGTGTFTPGDTDLNATYNATAADTAMGSITLTLTSTGNGNCLAVTDAMVITFTPSPIVDAGPDQFVCLSSPNSTLAGSVTGGSSTGTWTTSGTGTFSPNANTLNATYTPSAADTTAGSVTLTLTSTANGNCNAVVDQMTITYTTVPVVDAGTDQTVCSNNANVVLNGSIIGGGGNGIWTTSGSGTFSPGDTDLNATYIPSAADTTAGSVTITLTSTTGCSVVSDVMIITITDGPDVDAGADIFVCENNPDAALNGTVSGPTNTGDWSTSGNGTFSNGASSLNNTYVPDATDISNGSVMIFLTSTNNGGCNPDVDTLLITYTPPPVVDAGGDTSICANTPIQLNGTVTGGTGSGMWTTSGTGTFSPNANTLNAFYNASVADTTAGSVVLTLTSTNNGGCIPDSDQLTLTLTDAPVVNAGPDQNLCSNNSLVNVSGTVTIASGGMWSTTGGGTFADEFALTTDYTPDTSDLNNGSVQLILTSTGNGTCTPVNDTVTINFFPPPAVDAGTDIFICEGTVTASLNGTVSGITTTGNWTTLGSGTFTPASTNLNATYNLSSADTTAGSVVLVLESTNNNGCLAITDTVVITITTIPTVNAGSDTTVCGNNANIVLNGTVIGGGGTGNWTTSGSGTFSPNANTLNATYSPSSADTLSGSVTLTLAATNSCIPVTDDMVITFTTAPTVDAGPDQAFCASVNTVSLNGMINSVPAGAIWSTNGAGTFSSPTTTLNNVYTLDPSDINLTPLQFYLTSFGSGDCVEITDTLNINISGFPNAEFVFTNACENQSAQFTDTSTVTPGTITGWEWDFGNGDTSSVQNPTTVFTATGDYTVTLIVQTSGGCTDTISHNVHVNITPNADFSFTDGCFLDIPFTDNSSISGGTIISYEWDFGNGDTSSIQNPTEIYSDTGSYSVTLTVTSDSLCSNSITQVVNIIPQPIAGFTLNAVCGTTVVNFTDTSLVLGDSIVDWQWIYTNGTGNNSPNDSNDYGIFGPADVTLIVTSSSGCTDTASLSFTLNDNPVADFTPPGGNYNISETIDFHGLPDNMLSWTWDFGDSTGTGSGQDTTYAYAQSGTYTVILTVTDSLGCSDTVSYDFDINGGNVGVPGAFTPNGDGVNDILFVRGGPLAELSFTVYNEWGNEIFFTDDQSVGWEGKYKNKSQPGGVYVYILKATTVAGEEIDVQGYVTLIR